MAATYDHWLAHKHVLEKFVWDCTVGMRILMVWYKADLASLDVTWHLAEWLPTDNLY